MGPGHPPSSPQWVSTPVSAEANTPIGIAVLPDGRIFILQSPDAGLGGVGGGLTAYLGNFGTTFDAQEIAVANSADLAAMATRFISSTETEIHIAAYWQRGAQPVGTTQVQHLWSSYQIGSGFGEWQTESLAPPPHYDFSATLSIAARPNGEIDIVDLCTVPTDPKGGAAAEAVWYYPKAGSDAAFNGGTMVGNQFLGAGNQYLGVGGPIISVAPDGIAHVMIGLGMRNNLAGRLVAGSLTDYQTADGSTFSPFDMTGGETNFELGMLITDSVPSVSVRSNGDIDVVYLTNTADPPPPHQKLPTQTPELLYFTLPSGGNVWTVSQII